MNCSQTNFPSSRPPNSYPKEETTRKETNVEQLVQEIQQLVNFNRPQPLDGYATSEILKRLKLCYLKLSSITEYNPQKVSRFAKLIESTIFSVLFESHQQMSDDQVLEQLADLPFPSCVKDVDCALTLYQQAYNRCPEKALKAMGSWVSRSNLPLVDLGWSAEQLLSLSPYLETLNFTEMSLPSEQIAGFIQRASPRVKRLTFYFNRIDPLIAAALLRCKELEDLSITQTQLIEGAQLPLTAFSQLKSLQLDRVDNLNQPLDLSASEKLSRFLLNSCVFNYPILMPNKLPSLQQFSVNSCLDWNQPLTLAGCEQLISFKLHLCRAFNQTLDLKEARSLEEFLVTCCSSWNSALELPPSGNLKLVDLSECRQFNHALTLAGFPHLEKVNLTNCRAFNAPLALPPANLEKKIEVNLTNCFSYQQNQTPS